VRAALAGGAVLLAGWLTALTLGALGGFESLPELKLGGGSEKQSSDNSEPAEAAAGESASESVAGDDRSLGGSDQAAVEGDDSPAPSTRAPARQVVKPVRTPATAPTTVTAPGNANGKTDTKTTGKPITTPGTGSDGTTNAGGTGNGNAKGLYK
jgi:hypothetical protein